MRQYHKLLEDILEHGEKTDNRTGVGTLSLFGYQMRFNLQEGFPAVTTKKLLFRSVVGELLWFLEGSTDERRLAELTYGQDRTELVGKNTIWTANADTQGKQLGYINTEFKKELGPVYGSQWRNFGQDRNESGFPYKIGFDQIRWCISEIKNNPNSRRIIFSSWAPDKLSLMALPPCHVLFQFYVNNGKLSGHLYQRSGDSFLGIPFNIASYALLIHIIARECKLEVGDFVHTIGDAHIYLNHIDQVKEQLAREEFSLPKLIINKEFGLLDGLESGFELNSVDDFVLEDYNHHAYIKAPMAV